MLAHVHPKDKQTKKGDMSSGEFGGSARRAQSQGIRSVCTRPEPLAILIGGMIFHRRSHDPHNISQLTDIPTKFDLHPPNMPPPSPPTLPGDITTGGQECVSGTLEEVRKALYPSRGCRSDQQGIRSSIGRSSCLLLGVMAAVAGFF